MFISAVTLVSYAVYLTWRLVVKGRQSLSTVHLNQGYTPVALG